MYVCKCVYLYITSSRIICKIKFISVKILHMCG